MKTNIDNWERENNLPHLKIFRTELRNNLTPAEAKLWKFLQGKQLDGRKFRRQHSIGNYILDFYCPSETLAIELDGKAHFSGLLVGLNQKSFNRKFTNAINYRSIRGTLATS